MAEHYRTARLVDEGEACVSMIARLCYLGCVTVLLLKMKNCIEIILRCRNRKVVGLSSTLCRHFVGLDPA